MGARFRSWWQQIKPHPMATALIALLAVVIVLIILIILGYLFNWGWTGLGPYVGPPHPKDSDFQRGKTLWDWLQLLIIPFALAIIAILFNRAEHKNEQKIASDNQQEAALQDYIKEMSELLLHGKLRESHPGDEVRMIARVRTLTILPRLNDKRKRTILRFLYEASLINRDARIVDLSGADLSYVYLIDADERGGNLRGNKMGIFHFALLSEIEATLHRIDLSEVNLRRANLSGTDMIEANLSGASLFDADLSGVNLHDADLRGTNLTEADLTAADLSGADLSKACLICAKLTEVDLRGANLHGAYLTGAILYDANLSDADMSGADMSAVELADLSEAKVTPEQLATASSLKGATMPDGSIHP